MEPWFEPALDYWMSLAIAVIANAHEETKALLLGIGGVKGHKLKEHSPEDFRPAFQRLPEPKRAEAKKPKPTKDEEARWNAKLFAKLQIERARREKEAKAKREEKLAARKAKASKS